MSCLAVAGALGVGLPWPAAGPQPASPARVSRTLPADPPRQVSVTVSVGDVEIGGSARADLAIDMRRTGDDPRGDRLPLQIEEAPEAIHVVARQAGGGSDPALRASVVIRSPEDTRFTSIAIGEGSLVVDGLAGEVQATITRGDIRAARVSGRLRLETGIGDIEVDPAELVANGLIRLRAFNGHVTLGFAHRPTDARILALVLNGDIRSDIALTRKDAFGPRFAETTLGHGAPVVSLDVVTGSITIKAPGQ